MNNLSRRKRGRGAYLVVGYVEQRERVALQQRLSDSKLVKSHVLLLDVDTRGDLRTPISIRPRAPRRAFAAAAGAAQLGARINYKCPDVEVVDCRAL